MSWSEPSIARVITAEITRDQWTYRHITIVGLKSNGGSNDASFHIITSGLISALHRRLDAPDLITTIRPMDAWSRLSIARRLFIGWLRPISSLNRLFFTTERLALEISRNSNCPDTNFECHLIFCVLNAFPHPRNTWNQILIERERRKRGMKSHASDD